MRPLFLSPLRDAKISVLMSVSQSALPENLFRARISPESRKDSFSIFPLVVKRRVRQDAEIF